MNKDEQEKILAIGVIAVAVLWIYVISPAISWVQKNWIITVLVVGGIVVAGILVYIFFISPIKAEAHEEYEKEVEIKKSIIRKRILKEKSKEFENLGLTEEEKDYQINKWVEEAYMNELLRNKQIIGYSKEEKEYDKEPPLSQKLKESLINKVGTKCCYPNCQENIALDVHHIIPREEGGKNKENNLIVLCGTHHRLADRGAIPRDRLKLYSVSRIKIKS
jgi:5-methylcytosine-specific restriction endonuclease McrA